MKVISTLNRIRKPVLAIRFTISPFLCHWLSQPCIHLHLYGNGKKRNRIDDRGFSSLNARVCPPRPRHSAESTHLWVQIRIWIWMFPFEFPFGIRYHTVEQFPAAFQLGGVTGEEPGSPWVRDTAKEKLRTKRLLICLLSNLEIILLTRLTSGAWGKRIRATHSAGNAGDAVQLLLPLPLHLADTDTHPYRGPHPGDTVTDGVP